MVVVGNGMLYMPKEGVKFYRLDQYVISRDAMGKPVDAYIKEVVNVDSLEDDVKETCKVRPDPRKGTVDVYTEVHWKKDKVWYAQEINGIRVPNSKGEHPPHKTPWIPLRWQAIANANYGMGMVEQYMGDLMSLEGINQAIYSFAAVAAKIIFLVHPNATTDEEALQDASTGDFVTGMLEDIDVLKLEKYADFQSAEAIAAELTQRLSHSFLLTSGTVRHAERVTAEEIRMLAQELENVLGGVYTVLSGEMQLPFVRRLIAQMTAAGELPKLPDKAAEPLITTGFEALGRNHVTNRLRSFIADYVAAVGPEAASKWLNAEVIGQRLGAGHGIEGLDEVLKSREEVMRDMRSGLLASITQESAPGAIKAFTENATGSDS